MGMKVFLGVILALVVVALVFRLTKKPDTDSNLKATQESTIVATQPGGAGMHNTIIQEVIQATSYTYLRVKEDKNEYWVATVKDDATVGGKYSYNESEALEMNNFKSKDLDRTFPVIYFISENAGSEGMQASTAAPTTMGKPKVEQKTNEVIPQSTGGVSIAELYKNRAQYANKKVKVKGKVVKVNPEVMDRNWVHLQDGTSDSGNFDLTVTTLETANVGDIVEFEGTIILNKDFGAGYVYELIMESGAIRK
jgi:hypothetical protein